MDAVLARLVGTRTYHTPSFPFFWVRPNHDWEPLKGWSFTHFYRGEKTVHINMENYSGRRHLHIFCCPELKCFHQIA
ncbi:hypothetical protein MPF_0130 [Methanohalophilus portucalensis FDF-1]|uniref:Uncharacterized protein n=1 Tax=Methanohalophilus portucalensis FDF-1 TaxID=523843 RepID=A0A1L9C750_9EURY|nr:hypothetical protein MPF_0130 [Methanohalophilus portucalensis FDF-1]